MVGPSGASRADSCLSLTLWRVTRGAAAAAAATVEQGSAYAAAGGGANLRARGSRLAGGSAATPLPPLRLTELHFVALEGGSFVVPAPRAGLDRAPPGTVPALLPLFFPGLRAVAPPVQVAVQA